MAAKAKEKNTTILSILIPVYNEKYTVEQLVSEVLDAPLPEGVGRELVMVDDCSTDGTRKILEQLAEKHSEIQVHFHEANTGKGGAVRTAIEKATGDVIVIQDADLEYSPREFERMIRPILDGSADVVYGSRFQPREFKRVLFFWHSWGNRFLTQISNFFTNLDLTDMETCYKMARANIIKSIPIRSNRFGIEPEVTAKYSKRGCRIYEIPISYRGRSYREGKKITWWDGVKALFTIVYFWLVDDIYNEAYGGDTLYSLSRTHRFHRWMSDVIADYTGERILEIGSGMGTLALQILPRESYCATDVDDLHVDYLKGFFSGNRRVDVVKADVANKADFEHLAGTFDTALAMTVLEHVEDDQAALQNMFDVLEPGGCACIMVPRGPNLYGSLDEVLGHHRRYTEEDLETKLKEAGFEIEKVFTFNRVGVPAWYLNAKLLKRKRFSRLQLKLFDSTVWLWRRIDRIMPWPGLYIVAIGRKPGAETHA